MTTGIRIINFGPRAVNISVGDHSCESGAIRIDQLYAGGVSPEFCLHEGQSVWVQEVPEVKQAPDPQWREPAPTVQCAGDPLIAEGIQKIASGERSVS